MNRFVNGEGDTLIPKPNLARELGVSSRTLSRWLNDPKINLPHPPSCAGETISAAQR